MAIPELQGTKNSEERVAIQVWALERIIEARKRIADGDRGEAVAELNQAQIDMRSALPDRRSDAHLDMCKLYLKMAERHRGNSLMALKFLVPSLRHNLCALFFQIIGK